MVTQQQIEFLRKNVNQYSNLQLAEMFGRTKSAIEKVLYRSGIKREPTVSLNMQVAHLRKGGQSGIKNYNWKGGVSTDNMRYRNRQKERWPEKESCRRATSQAIKSKIISKRPCEICGTMERLEAHHDDYTKLLTVRWFCYKHHRDLHNGKIVQTNAA